MVHLFLFLYLRQSKQRRIIVRDGAFASAL